MQKKSRLIDPFRAVFLGYCGLTETSSGIFKCKKNYRTQLSGTTAG